MLDFLKRLVGFPKPEQVTEAPQKVEAPVLIVEPVVEAPVVAAPVVAPVVTTPVAVVKEKPKKQPAAIKTAAKPRAVASKPKTVASKPKAADAPAPKKPAPRKPRMKVAK
jgi:hypothetical protein